MGPRVTPVHFFLANFDSSDGGGLNFFICSSEESMNENITLKVKKKKKNTLLYQRLKQNVEFQLAQFIKFTVAQF